LDQDAQEPFAETADLVRSNVELLVATGPEIALPAALAASFRSSCGPSTTTRAPMAEEPGAARWQHHLSLQTELAAKQVCVDGRRIDFMVDTGASVIALKPEDAAMLGIRPAASDYVAPVKTANGVIRVALVEPNTVEIEDLEVHNVAAMVLPAGVAPENLLGLSFLRRLGRFEYADGKLVPEQ
jgi:aspartyl protease family protein